MDFSQFNLFLASAPHTMPSMEIYFIGTSSVLMGMMTSICGGAGVFAVPMMMAAGIPPINVLALNRMSDLGVVAGALRNYVKAKSIDWSLAWKASIPVGIGAYIGSSVVVSMPPETLKVIVLVGISVGTFFLLKPIKQLQHKETKTSIWGWVWLIILGLWNGALAMAGGTFCVIILVYFFHKTFLQARSTDIAISIPETIISCVILTLGSTLTWQPLLVMFGCSFFGAWIGSHLAVQKGSPFIRNTMVIVAVMMALKVAYDIFM